MMAHANLVVATIKEAGGDLARCYERARKAIQHIMQQTIGDPTIKIKESEQATHTPHGIEPLFTEELSGGHGVLSSMQALETNAASEDIVRSLGIKNGNKRFHTVGNGPLVLGNRRIGFLEMTRMSSRKGSK